MGAPRPMTYEQTGVRDQQGALTAIARHLQPTFAFPEGAEIIGGFGGYASVVKLSDDLALALCTDGVGSKTIIASRLGRYDTIGFDCVAMNVNDLICVGARPLAMVDYLGVHTLDEARTDAILEGLGAAAKEAGVAIPGGETAQLPEVIGSDGTTPGDETAFDLVGTCVGVLAPQEMITGSELRSGDALIGLASSGIHSNGLSLARRVLLDRYSLNDVLPELGRPLGEELLEPTRIYVRAVRALTDARIRPRGIAHITGDGLLNLCRLEAAAGYRIETLPAEPPIFDVIRRAGPIDDAEMFRVFNMGVGLVIGVVPGDLDRALESLTERGYPAERIGTVSDERGVVRIETRHLTGSLEEGFVRT